MKIEQWFALLEADGSLVAIVDDYEEALELRGAAILETARERGVSVLDLDAASDDLTIETVYVVPPSYVEAMRLVPADVRKRLAVDYPALADVYGFPPSRRVH